MINQSELDSIVDAVTPSAVELRRLLHRHPEPSYQEYRTTALVASFLDQNGVAYRDRKPATGLWVDLGAHPTIGFRADLDALPISEPEDNEPRSQNPGWMHACGHDAHAAIAFGLTLALRQLDPPPAVRVLFQPAEESFPGGASDMVGEGICDGLKAMIAFHIDPAMATGLVGTLVGPITASADKFSIVLEGPGGHTARPHQTVDLIADAARLVHELPGALRRTIDARSPLTIAFGTLHGGTSGNVIPTRVEMQGTARTLDHELWEALPGLFDKAISGLMSTSGAQFHLDYVQAIPPVVNDAAVISAAEKGLVEVLGEDAVVPTRPSMGGEDFANYLRVVPGALLRLGSTGRGADLHSPGFLLDEGSIKVGIRAGLGAIMGMAREL